MRSIILTRPQAESEAQAAVLRAQGHSVIISPVLDIVPRDFIVPPLSTYQALVFTSLQAVDVFAARCPTRDLPVYTVGDVTAQRVKAAGFTDIRSASGSLESLNTLLAGAGLVTDWSVLHVSGDVVRGAVAVPGVKVERLIVYHAVAAQTLTPEAKAALAAHTAKAVLFFSPRSAEIFKILLRQAGLEAAVSFTKALCIADSVVKSLQDLPWQAIRVAQAPTGEAVAALLDDDFEE